jgi:hypothetical protein
MVLQAKRCEEVPLDIDVAPEIGLREAKRIASQDHRTDDARVAAHQGEPRFRFVRDGFAESQGGAVPQAQRETPIVTTKQTLQ